MDHRDVYAAVAELQLQQRAAALEGRSVRSAEQRAPANQVEELCCSYLRSRFPEFAQPADGSEGAGPAGEVGAEPEAGARPKGKARKVTKEKVP